VLLVLFLCVLQAVELQLHEQQLQQQKDEQLRLREEQRQRDLQREHEALQRRLSSSTTSRKPYIIPNGLSLPRRGEHPDKCYREVP